MFLLVALKVVSVLIPKNIQLINWRISQDGTQLSLSRKILLAPVPMYLPLTMALVKERCHGYSTHIHLCVPEKLMLRVVLQVNPLHKVVFAEEEKQPALVFFMAYVKYAKCLK